KTFGDRMIIECSDCAARQCEHGGCVVAALHAMETSIPKQPERPDWILEAPPRFDARELEAIAILSDAGRVPALLPPAGAPSATTDDGDETVYWPRSTAYERTG